MISSKVYPMSLDKATVARIATLARIKLPEADQAALAGDLAAILKWVEQLDEVDTDGVEPMTSVGRMVMTLREDVVTDGACDEAILANAPNAARGFFTVPKVIE
jgi:aspartyl-tRNA(Asn)/glutamyl-tRNA(Gln) amidotransferase subunit C